MIEIKNPNLVTKKEWTKVYTYLRDIEGFSDFNKSKSKYTIGHWKLSFGKTYIMDKSTKKVYHANQVEYRKHVMVNNTHESLYYEIFETKEFSKTTELLAYIIKHSQSFNYLRLNTYPADYRYKIEGIEVKTVVLRKEICDNKRKEFEITKRIGFTEFEIEEYGIVEHEDYLTFTNIVGNDRYYQQLELALNEPKRYTIMNLFHGTSHEGAVNIIRNGFRESRSGSLGPGVYAGKYEKAKSFAYSRDDNKVSEKVIFEIEVILKDVKTSHNMENIDKEYDYYYTGFKNPEWVIRDADRILIKKLHYHI